MAKKPETYHFKFVKTNDFRTVGVNGAFGGITVNGQINMNFYIDVLELPRDLEHTVLNNQLSKHPIKKITTGTHGSVREVPFGVNFDIKTAKNLVVWLQGHINNWEDKNKVINDGKEVQNGGI